jgi:asparagine synthase (glutamine-hydrolysing)
VRERIVAQLLHDVTSVPARFDRALLALWMHRCSLGTARSMRALADDLGAGLLMPFYEPRYIAALMAFGGRRGWGSRKHGLMALAGGYLPEESFDRSDPAHIAEVLFGARTRAFAEGWTGQGLDDALVDPELVRAAWLTDVPDWRAGALMQLAWLSDRLAEAKDDADEQTPQRTEALT